MPKHLLGRQQHGLWATLEDLGSSVCYLRRSENVDSASWPLKASSMSGLQNIDIYVGFLEMAMSTDIIRRQLSVQYRSIGTRGSDKPIYLNVGSEGRDTGHWKSGTWSI